MLPAILAAVGIGAYLYKKKQTMRFSGLGLPDFDVALEPGYSYWADERFPGGHSSSNMKLSPGFEWHEKPIPPHSDYSDLATGTQPGTIQSDPYKKIDYVYDTGVDFYRSNMPFHAVPPQSQMGDNSFGGKFAGPGTNAFSTMITDTADRVSSFIKG